MTIQTTGVKNTFAEENVRNSNVRDILLPRKLISTICHKTGIDNIFTLDDIDTTTTKICDITTQDLNKDTNTTNKHRTLYQV